MKKNLYAASEVRNSGVPLGFFAVFVLGQTLANLLSSFSLFAPLKVFLILADGQLPSFFPQALINLPIEVFAGLALSLAAITYWVGSFVARFVSSRALAQLVQGATEGPSSFRARTIHILAGYTSTNALLVVISALTIFWIFPAFLLFFFLLEVCIAMFFLPSLLGQHGHTSRQNAVGVYRRSTLWITVVAASLGFVVANPDWGTTAGLISILLGREFHQAQVRVAMAFGRSVNLGDVSRLMLSMNGVGKPLRNGPEKLPPAPGPAAQTINSLWRQLPSRTAVEMLTSLREGIWSDAQGKELINDLEKLAAISGLLRDIQVPEALEFKIEATISQNFVIYKVSGADAWISAWPTPEVLRRITSAPSANFSILWKLWM